MAFSFGATSMKLYGQADPARVAALYAPQEQPVDMFSSATGEGVTNWLGKNKYGTGSAFFPGATMLAPAANAYQRYTKQDASNIPEADKPKPTMDAMPKPTGESPERPLSPMSVRFYQRLYGMQDKHQNESMLRQLAGRVDARAPLHASNNTAFTAASMAGTNHMAPPQHMTRQPSTAPTAMDLPY